MTVAADVNSSDSPLETDDSDEPAETHITETEETPTEVAADTAAKTAEHADPPHPELQAAIVFNPIKIDLEVMKAAVAAAEKAAGWSETLWFETSEGDPGEGMARDAVAAGVAVVMAAGGDGTVRAVASGLRGSGVPIALVPSGTGNLLARNLGLTLNQIDLSISTAFTGDDRPIDVGVVEVERESGSTEQHVFVVMAGLGLDAQMIANTDPKLKKRAGWVAYVDAIAKSLRDSNRLHIRYNLDGEGNRTATVHTILIGNCGLLPGNIQLLPDAAIDDGIFDIVALRPEGFFGWAQIWVKVVWENGVLHRSQAGRKIMSLTKEVRTLRYLKGKELVMRLEQPEEFEMDGDAFGKGIAFKTVVDPGALVVKVPAAG